ncbi:MAG: putative motility protein [Oscillospiraceae bacterium]|nr:putative motility protein [Oscillospiraceae bacterium]
MMNIMSAATIPNVSSAASLPHGLSLTVMKKGMESQEQLALQQIQMMAPPTPGKGEFIDVYA